MFSGVSPKSLTPDGSKSLSVLQLALAALTSWRMPKPSRRARIGTLIAATLATGFTIGAFAQTIDVRQWQGVTAVTRQPEQVFVTTQAEWRSLWSRVGLAPPDHFEPSRTNADGWSI